MMGWLGIITKLLDLFIAGTATYEEFVAMQERVKAMQAEGRDPTAEEFAEIFDQLDEDTQAIIDIDDANQGEK